jgi:tetratricopeptide (TPR) repeat protein
MKQRTKTSPNDAKHRSGEAESDQPGTPPLFAAWFVRWKDWLTAIALAAAVFLAYQPAWQGGFIWDDDAHVRPELQSWQGLGRIWCDLKATQQYYPLLHSAFWLEYRLWGDATLGYHPVNILLHVVAALLVAVILRRLKIPGAYLAAAIFALHPVQVESVAWITELKNTLSAVFYLSAALVYLRFDDSRKNRWYFLALGLFLLGLLSKTVTATLPAALLVVFWWQRGRLSWRRDVLPLLPFFAVGAVAGVFTAMVERKLGGAEGAAFDFTFVERCLIAGRAIWFYLGKLVWPVDLIFIYPRWHVSQAVWWQYLFPLAALLLLAGLWAIRPRCRGPLAALLFFAGTLFPVLGFCNVYPFIFSFVADHFQYLASLGIIALASAGVVLALNRWRQWGRWPAYCLCGALLLVLATRTWAQCCIYSDVEPLYLTTIKRNPDCWMAYLNLGQVLGSRGQLDEAMGCYAKALQINPDCKMAHLDLGEALARCHRLSDAVAEYRAALAIDPDYAEAHYNLGNVLMMRERLPEAVAEYRKALAIRHDFAEARRNLDLALSHLEELRTKGSPR